MPPTNTLLSPTTEPLPRLILYAQTFHDSAGNYISLLPLITHHTGVTHVNIAAIHINEGPGNITLNDDAPNHEKFNTLWSEVRWLKGAGVKVLGMLGGAAKGSYERLSGTEEQFESYYLPLRDLLRTLPLDGIDLDIEEQISLNTATRLISRLRSDFGPEFLITMAPVATALIPDPRIPSPPRPALSPTPMPNPLHPTLPHLSGFSYPALETSIFGREIAWYNTQFYCGWGDASSTQWYDAIVAAGWDPKRVVLGVVTNEGNGSGHVGVSRLREVVADLRRKFASRGGFGGVMGWEWFNAGAGAERDVCCDLARSTASSSTRAGDGGGVWSSPQASWAASLGHVLRSPMPQPQASTTAFGGVTADQIRQMVTRLPEPSVPWPEEKVKFLLEIGFERHEAIAALNATDGNVDTAAGLLFDT